MGGELEGGIFLGPNESKTIVEWILFLKINSKENIIKQMKLEYLNWSEARETDEEEDEEEDEDEEVYYMNDLYLSSNQIEDDYDKFHKKLHELKLELVCIHNCETNVFKVGKLVSSYNTQINEYIINHNKKLWEEYGVNNIHIFGGMIGDFEVEFN